MLALLGTSACGDATPSGDRTRAPIHVVAERVGPRFDGIALAHGAQGAVAVWSAPHGLERRRLRPNGAPEAEAVHLGPRCGGGVAAARGREGALAIACLRLPQWPAGKPGHVVFLRVGPDGEVRDRHVLGAAGRDSQGIDAEATPRGIRVAWHDGTVGRWRIRAVRVPPAGEGPPGHARPLSGRGSVPYGAPSVWARGGQVLVTWAETWLGRTRQGAGHIRVHRSRGGARRAATVRWPDPTPRLIRAAGRFHLLFRDEHPEGWDLGLQLLPLGEGLRAEQGPRRLGDADGPGGPAVARCADGFRIATPLFWGEDLILGVHDLDAALYRRSNQQPIHQHTRSFEQTALLCEGDRLLVLAAERGDSTQHRVDLVAARL